MHRHHLVLLLRQRAVMSEETHAGTEREDESFTASIISVSSYRSLPVLHGDFLALLQPLPVFLQRTDGVPRLTPRASLGAVGQRAFGLVLYITKDRLVRCRKV